MSCDIPDVKVKRCYTMIVYLRKIEKKVSVQDELGNCSEKKEVVIYDDKETTKTTVVEVNKEVGFFKIYRYLILLTKI